MRLLSQALAVPAVLLVVGCAHSINITPPLDALRADDVKRIDRQVGYYISPADLAKQVTTPGGGGDKVKYFPYKESEPALKFVLANVFTKVHAVPSPDDRAFLRTNEIAWLFLLKIETDSSSESAFTWPPTHFEMTLVCTALKPTGEVAWRSSEIKGVGKATFAEFKNELSLAARRAVRDAFLKLHAEIAVSQAFR